MKYLFLILGFLSISCFTIAKNVDPIIDKNSNKYIRDTVTFNTANGNLQVGRECGDQVNELWTSTYLKVGPEVYQEAERKGLTEEVISIEFKRDENCDITHYSIRQKSQLESLNEVAVKFCAEIIQLMELQQNAEHLSCPTKACTNILIPISLSIYG